MSVANNKQKSLEKINGSNSGSKPLLEERAKSVRCNDQMRQEDHFFLHIFIFIAMKQATQQYIAENGVFQDNLEKNVRQKTFCRILLLDR